jgi:hypothetical protein
MPELGGDIVMASNPDGRCVVQFMKTPLLLVVAQTSRTNWLIEFPPRQMSFLASVGSGQWPWPRRPMGFMGRGSPPKRFAWLYLNAALEGDSLPPELHFARKADGGWRLENANSGESVEGFLGP